jgi:hypothetical protein
LFNATTNTRYNIDPIRNSGATLLWDWPGRVRERKRRSFQAATKAARRGEIYYEGRHGKLKCCTATKTCTGTGNRKCIIFTGRVLLHDRIVFRIRI